MSMHFRKSVRIVPGVRLNISSRGFSTTIGGHGASVNIGPKGTYLNVGIPGSGISYRGRLDRSVPQPVRPKNRRPSPAEALPTDPYLIPGTRVDFGVGEVSEMTSPGLSNFKSLVIETRQQKLSIEQEIRSASGQLLWAKTKLVLAYLPPFWPFTRKKLPKLRGAIDEYRKDMENLRENLRNTVVKVDFDLGSEIAGPFKRLDAAFDELMQAQKHWSIQTQQRIDRVAARSAAGVVVNRKPVKIFRGSDPLIQTDTIPMAFKTANGRSTAYVYPGFLLVSGHQDFAVIDMADLKIRGSITRFVEDSSVPSDAEVVGHTWVKANKDGSRDRRFSNNRQIPIVHYGELSFAASGGLNELYQFSRWEPCHAFARALEDLSKTVSSKFEHNHK